MPDKRNAETIIKALPKIFDMIETNDFPFIAKVQKSGAVELCKKDLMIHKGHTVQKTKMKKSKSEKSSEEYQRFEKLAKSLIAVPKSEIDKRQVEYERWRKVGKKRKTA